ncbi:MAG: DUF3488 domain-containing protein [Deltaproteobacteria bacterium]|nr:DUF3488 domain-containing protein [Deltaproteobacteria bacterium]MBN2670837.1 DUF3488 domain-containing protein [Deltaproteobacteria bacterium]
MKFETIHRISVFSLATMAVAPLVLSRELSIYLGPAFACFLIAGWFIPRTVRVTPFFIHTAPVLAALLFLLQAFRIAQGEHLASASIEFAVLLLGIKLCTNHTYADFQQTVLLAFVAIIASTVTSYQISYAFYFFSYIILLPLAMSLTLLRKEMEQRFTKADEQTQLRLLTSKRVIQTRFAAGWAITVFGLVLVVVGLFLSIPRWGFGMGGGTLFGKQILGFTNEVKIGDLSQTIENETVYLRLWPLEPKQPNPTVLPLKFRGAVFDTYQDGTWQKSADTRFRFPLSSDGVYAFFNHVPMRGARFKIMQEPTNPSYLFVPSGTHHIQMERSRHRGRLRYQRLQINPMGVIKYNDAKRVGIRYTAMVDGSPVISDTVSDMSPFLRVPAETENVAALAAAWSGNASTAEQQIRNILTHFFKEYRYTKVISADERSDALNTNILEQFLFDYKRGTCEHYATATTIMFRTLGIPSRFVTGFSGARWNPIGEYYTVDANAAHAWTEVYVNGMWHTVDATPQAGGTGNSGSEQPHTSYISLFYDTLAMKWHQYVIDYDEGSQQALLAALKPAFTTRSSNRPAGIPRNTVLAILVLLVFGFAVYRVWSYLRRPRRRFAKNSRPAKQQATVLFLLLEKKLQPFTGQRTPYETPMQYVIRAEQRLPKLKPFLESFLTHYLQARFGDTPFSAGQFDSYRRDIPIQIKSAANTNK